MPSILYKMDQSPPSRAVMMLIDILGVQREFEMRDLNPVLREQDRPEIVRKSPMKTIPILVEGDFWLGDSHAIMLYLMEKYGRSEHSKLYPPDQHTRATINHRLFFDCGVLFPRLRSIMAPTYGGKLTEITKSQILNAEEAYGMLETYLSETLYLADDVVTLADISAITSAAALDGLHAVDETRYPKLKRWLRNMSAQDFCRRINVPASEMQVRILKKLMKINKQKLQSKL